MTNSEKINELWKEYREHMEKAKEIGKSILALVNPTPDEVQSAIEFISDDEEAFDPEMYEGPAMIAETVIELRDIEKETE